jgi:hypothetical protein
MRMRQAPVRSTSGRAAAATLLALWQVLAQAGPARAHLPDRALFEDLQPATPVMNDAFAPGADAMPAPPLAGTLRIEAAVMSTDPRLRQPVVGGRDARVFPGIELAFVTVGDRLVPLRRGTMVAESRPGAAPSYWNVIPQVGRAWREVGEHGWARAAVPLMLVNDTENHAHQGLATFMYRDRVVSAVRMQFVQQTAPYLLHQHFIAWGAAHAAFEPWPRNEAARAQRAAEETAAAAELAVRLPARPLEELAAGAPAGTLDGFGGPVLPAWTVAQALVREGTLYYRAMPTPFGPYPYPLEMRFGVRSVTKGVCAPLALLHLAQLYGPQVLELKIGDYVPGLDPKYRRVRFIDAANMASGYGGAGSTRTQPNDMYDGYLGGDYDAWYTAPSLADKIAQVSAHDKPYPWPPGAVVRYRDQDYFLLGAALDAYLKSVRGAQADIWNMVEREVLGPIGIAHAPIVRTREPGGAAGIAWFNAGYYPTLDDLAKIALLYQHHGLQGGVQLLHRGLTDALLAGEGSLSKTAAPAGGGGVAGDTDGRYMMGLHYVAYTGSASGRPFLLPTLEGSGENEVVLYPNGLVSIRMAKAAQLPAGMAHAAGDTLATIRAVDRLEPF